MSTPAIHSLKQHPELKNANFDILCQKATKELVELNPDLNKAITKEELKVPKGYYDFIVQMNMSVESELILIKLKPKYWIGYFQEDKEVIKQ